MTISSQTCVVAEDRRQAALAWAARVHLVAPGTRSTSSATPRTVDRVRAGPRHADASLAALASMG
ncbi:MAG: hypothetical protein AVDCRST_MAG73-640 [uncultured Thermomicrobiales bacterium]|uniref:Uncharacterized protein n=1 Tax=uncultured Thermomicrobiales bacterium TaxID=1645740 RepID=A0A6J4TN82_9BACT|nr:MAG: hypothetical protein AVDCRST_MAG73-640 [uncultured Thermomicrobiales bacterium]